MGLILLIPLSEEMKEVTSGDCTTPAGRLGCSDLAEHTTVLKHPGPAKAQALT